jgi:DNA-binding Xre family transcriptional regulator
MTPVQIMDKIRRAMIADGRSSVELEAATDIHQVNIRQFKAGKRELPLEQLAKLAKALNLEITVTDKAKAK